MIEQQDPIPGLSWSLSQVLSHIQGSLVEPFPFLPSKLQVGTCCGILRLPRCWAGKNRISSKGEAGGVGASDLDSEDWKLSEREAFRMEMPATSLGCPPERRWDPAGGSWRAAWKRWRE